MATAIMNRINELTAERQALYGKAGNGLRADPDVRARIQLIGGELDRLWELRRRERAGQRDGIDLLVDQSYERLYGANYEDAIAPAAVAEAEERIPAAA